MGTRTSYFEPSSLFQDHPHACGDKCAYQNHFIHHPGSSPRVWGQVTVSPLLVALCGIIPTRVGTSSFGVYDYRHVRDHPHACGDKFVSLYMLKPLMGSSPRVWGQEVQSGHLPQHKRIIPTRVGTSSECSRELYCPEDHPHACGDKNLSLHRRYLSAGSSPRVWGQGKQAEVHI